MEILAVVEPATQMTVWDCTGRVDFWNGVKTLYKSIVPIYIYTVLCRSLVGKQGRYELTCWSSEEVQNIC